MKVRIPFVVNPEGKWAAGGYPGIEKDPDWGFLMDQADDGEEANSDYQRGWIEVDLPQPQATVSAVGTVEAT
jgi:hypothetical protein